MSPKNDLNVYKVFLAVSQSWLCDGDDDCVDGGSSSSFVALDFLHLVFPLFFLQRVAAALASSHHVRGTRRRRRRRRRRRNRGDEFVKLQIISLVREFKQQQQQ